MSCIRQHKVERILSGRHAVRQAAAQEFAEWPNHHPKATLIRMDDAMFKAMQML